MGTPLRVFEYAAHPPKQTRDERGRLVSQKFYESVTESSDDPFQFLDQVASRLVYFSLDTEMSGDFVCERAHRILCRLPSTPPSLEKIYPEFFERHDHCFLSGLDSNFQLFSEKWNDLAVISKLDSNTIRLALALSCDRFWGPERPRIRHSNTEGVVFHPLDDWESGGMQYYVNTVAEMLEETTFRLAECINEDRKAAQA